MKFALAELPASVRSLARTPSSRTWALALGLIFGALLWLIVWYGETAYSIVAIWNRSETYAHGYLIVPISAWLIWKNRYENSQQLPWPNLWGLPVIALVGFGWLMARLAGAGVVQQYALVLMIPLLVWTILGTKVVKTLCFPLCFLLLAVSFGDFLLPPLMEGTAEFTIFALKLSGIPVYREGLFFNIPSGNWSVVEACSGLRYLIASFTLGLLYAYLTYRSLMRRMIFVVIAIVLPILANWLRAYGIVMIGHWSSMKLAVGVDHLIYGWVFFGIVMMIMFAIGAKWREDDLAPDVRKEFMPDVSPQVRPPLAAFMIASLASIVLVSVWPALAAQREGAIASAPPVLVAPIPAHGWRPDTAEIADLTLHFLNTRARIRQTYSNNGQRVSLFVGYYRNQAQTSQLITSNNVLVPSEGSNWRVTSPNVAQTIRYQVFGIIWN